MNSVDTLNNMRDIKKKSDHSHTKRSFNITVIITEWMLKELTSFNFFHTSSMHFTVSANIAGLFIWLMFPKTPHILFQIVHADIKVHPGSVQSSYLLVVSSKLSLSSVGDWEIQCNLNYRD